MNSTSKVWTPRSTMTEAQRSVLTVPYSGTEPMTQELHLSLLERKIAQMVQRNPQRAIEVMEMSQENAPELYALAQQALPSELPAILVRSDGMNRLLSLIDWKKEARKTGQPAAKPAPIDLQETLEQIA